MIEIGPNLLVAIQAFCGVLGVCALLFFMYRLVRDN
jgi:hypothetical protein